MPIKIYPPNKSSGDFFIGDIKSDVGKAFFKVGDNVVDMFGAD